VKANDGAEGQSVSNTEDAFQRYLATKKGVDDRALNRHVWEALREALTGRRELRALEVGAGIGTMVERLVEWELLGPRSERDPATLSLTLLDSSSATIAAGRRRLAAWAGEHGFAARPTGDGLDLRAPGLSLALAFREGDFFQFARSSGVAPYDLAIAHAVLDLLDVPAALAALRRLLAPGGLLYATVTFDGVTALEPAVEPALDALVEELYHRTMDARTTDGSPSGDRHAGRHLYHRLRDAGFEVLGLGGSDWAVFPTTDGYPGDEASFLHFIVDTIDAALHDHPDLDAGRFAAWVRERHAQIDRAELVYIAHQLDVLARVPRIQAPPGTSPS
jgi:SAM-dependent methyltransferase